MPAPFWAVLGRQPLWALWRPSVMALALLAGGGYLWLAGPFRSRRPSAAGRARPLAFFLMLVVLYATFGSPVDWVGAHLLFSADMIEHVVDTMVLPPLLLIGLPPWATARCLAFAPLGATWRTLTRPAVAVLLLTGTLTAWHTSLLLHATLVDPTVHVIEDVSLFAAALCFWWPVMAPSPAERLPELRRLLHLLFGAMLSWPLFYALTLRPVSHSYYPLYIRAAQQAGLASPVAFSLRDQRIGGIIMMGSMMIVLGVVAAAAFSNWVFQEEARDDEDRQWEGAPTHTGR